MYRSSYETERNATPGGGHRPQRDVWDSACDEVLAAGRAIKEAFRRFSPGDVPGDGGKGKRFDARKSARHEAMAKARQETERWETIASRGDGCDIQAGDEEQVQREMRRVFAVAFDQYLHAVEEMVGKTLKGSNDRESQVALAGMLSSLSSASCRMGFSKVQRLLDQLDLRIRLLGRDPRVGLAREIRLGILRDVFELRKMAAQMKRLSD
jgi:hypothetical protein